MSRPSRSSIAEKRILPASKRGMALKSAPCLKKLQVLIILNSVHACLRYCYLA